MGCPKRAAKINEQEFRSILKAPLESDVSVVVSTYSTERATDVMECIASIGRQTLPAKEILLVLDPDEKLVEFYRNIVPNDVKVMTSNGRGLSNARNTGAKSAQGHIVAFIDDDALADEKWLQNLVANYEDSDVVGVGGFISPLWDRRPPTWFPEEFYWTVGCSFKGLPEERTAVRNPIGCNMSFRKSVFERVGYFNADVGRIGKRLLDGEEAEFSVRLLDKMPTSRIVYDPSVLVYHKVPPHRMSIIYTLKRAFYQGISKGALANAKLKSPRWLSYEQNYLKYLLGRSVPQRIKNVFRFSALSQLLSLMILTPTVLIGYLIGKSKV